MEVGACAEREVPRIASRIRRARGSSPRRPTWSVPLDFLPNIPQTFTHTPVQERANLSQSVDEETDLQLHTPRPECTRSLLGAGTTMTPRTERLGWLAGLAILVVACDPDVQIVRIAAQDFRFDPAEVRVSAGRPLRLKIVNEGREPHEFAGPILSDLRIRLTTDSASDAVARPDGIRILPGQSLELTLQLPPGAYPFHCRVRGHKGMTGILLVEESLSR